MELLLTRPSLRVSTLGATVGLAALTLCGCVTRGYQLAPKNTPPPEALRLEAAQPPIGAAVGTVVANVHRRHKVEAEFTRRRPGICQSFENSGWT